MPFASIYLLAGSAEGQGFRLDDDAGTDCSRLAAHLEGQGLRVLAVNRAASRLSVEASRDELDRLEQSLLSGKGLPDSLLRRAEADRIAIMRSDREIPARHHSIEVGRGLTDNQMGFWPSEVLARYQLSPTRAPARRPISVICLGTEASQSDLASACASMAIPCPTIVDRSAKALRFGDRGVTLESAIDHQCAAAAAAGGELLSFTADRNEMSAVDMLYDFATDAAAAGGSASISWGAAESEWSPRALEMIHLTLDLARRNGIDVFVASGDDLASDGIADGRLHVDFPASSPAAIGVGGTRLPLDGAGESEVVWNMGAGGTGGGFSDIFPLPDAQAGAVRATYPQARMRGVPDVAAHSDPRLPYRVVLGGEERLAAGTSAAAPLWASLAAWLDGQDGEGRSLIERLYAKRNLNDVVQGDNRSAAGGYDAAAGWDPCTGLGTPGPSLLLPGQKIG
jgi:kumamolisin